MKYFVYLIECKDRSIYTGITTDVSRRFKEHEAGIASKYTRSRGVRKIIYKERVGTKSKALKREIEIKAWPRKKKLELIGFKKYSS